MWVDPETILRVVDRQFEFLLSADGPRRLRLLPGVLSYLEREPATNAVLRDLQEEAERTLADYENACAEARARLLAIWEEYGRQLRDALETGSSSHTRDALGTTEGYEESLRSPPRALTLPALMIGTRLVDEVPRRQALKLRHWGKWVADQDRSEDALEPWLDDLLGRSEQVGQFVEHAFRQVQLAVESQGGFALASLRHIVERLHPSVSDVVTLAMHRDYRAAAFARTGAVSESAEIARNASKVAEFAELLRDQIHQRVLLSLSRWAIVSRFAARCETFHRERLFVKAEQKTRLAERALTLEFAEYLFDAGFTPVLDPEVAGLKPDVIAAASSSLFYAEAKQYKHRSPVAKLVSAYHQVWSTWMRAEKQHPLREGFLVVFRRGGPLVHLPPVLILGERRLYSTLIDLSPHAGSQETYPPVTVDANRLLPGG